MFTQILARVRVHVSLDRYSQDLAYTFICINEVSRGVCQAESAKLWAGRGKSSKFKIVIKSDLGENDDFGAFWRCLEKASELTIKLTIGRHSKTIIDRCTSCDIDRRRNAQKAQLASDDLELKSSPIYNITPDKF
ncbi:hypothetical protein F2Q68_00036228 [Brassica cretica]|uniref:Uncharacterized protein n=1 Tax=Brassica cretica TaxID=69181 RepID=A0A8S9H1R9_BRACR|nr:hypothetical protein F2Q68_00036228 [Brassica cretica]